MGQKNDFGQNSYRSSYIPCTRNLGPFAPLLPTWKIDFEVIVAFLGPFLGVDRQKSLAGVVLKKLGNFKIFTKKKLRYSSIFQNFQLRCTTKTRWDILKNFWVFFCPLTVLYWISDVKMSFLSFGTQNNKGLTSQGSSKQCSNCLSPDWPI